MTRMPRHSDRAMILAARMVTGVVVVSALYFAQPVLTPFGIALLVAFMLQPAVRFLRKHKLPNGAAVALSAGTFFSAIVAVGLLIGGQLVSFTREIPKYKENLIAKIQDLREATKGDALKNVQNTVDELVKEVGKGEATAEKTAAPPPVAKESAAVQSSGMSSLGSLLGFVGNAGVVFLLAVLMLLNWADLRDRLISLIDQNLTITTAALDDAGVRVSRYLATQFIVNSCTGIVVWIALSAVGVQYAGLMGLCAALFRYVPYVGPVAAAALPVIVSITTSPGWAPVIAVVSIFAVLELLLNNVIEPWVYGTRLGVSEIGIILATVLWTFLWGTAGLVLATPLTVCLVVLGEHVPALAFLSKLLSDKKQLPAHATLTQRLMAGDSIEALDVLSTYAETRSSAELFDHVVVPALAQIRHEQRLGHLDEEAAARISVELPKLANEVGPISDSDSRPALRNDSHFAVWGICPLSEVIADLLPSRFSGIPTEFLSFKASTISTDVIQKLTEIQPLGICLIHLDASDFPRVLVTAKRLCKSMPSLAVMVARWGDRGITEAEQLKLQTVGVSKIVNDPADLRAWLLPQAVNRASVIESIPETGVQPGPAQSEQ